MMRESKNEVPMMSTSTLSNRLSFTLIDLAASTGLPVQTLRREIKAGNLPSRLVGKRRLVLREDAVKWLRSFSDDTPRRIGTPAR